MDLIPSIDLRGGKVVRLRLGDFGHVTEYGDDPIAVARRWISEGAARLHIVDLDGALAGRPVQDDVIARVVRDTGVPCQVAGGLRDRAAVASALEAGADRVVLGTALLRDPALGSTLVREFGEERIAAALDVRDGSAVGEGWRIGAAGVPMDQAMRTLADAGVVRFVVTAIARDGILAGPDLDLLEAARAVVPSVAIIASGGISTLDDIRTLAGLEVEGAILGRALYEGRLDLRSAKAAAAA